MLQNCDACKLAGGAPQTVRSAMAGRKPAQRSNQTALKQALERPTFTARKESGTRRDAAAERQADEIGARIGASLGGAAEIGPGPLRPDVRAAAESQLGVSLEGTHLASDRAAHALTAQNHAVAVAENPTVHFAPGRLSLSTHNGRALLGHELTHVAQQRRHGITARQAQHDCDSSGADATADEKYADANPGKVFDMDPDPKSPSDEFILWNYCVGGTKPRPDHVKRLEQAAKRWKQLTETGTGKDKAVRKDLRVKISGGAGDTGVYPLLAKRRAESVRDVLVANGVPTDKIDTTGEDADKPLGDEPGAGGAARNRRATVALYSPTPVANDLSPFIDVDVSNLKIGPGSRDDLVTFDTRKNFHAIRTAGAVSASADVTARSLLDPAEVGFLQFLTGDTRIASYTDPKTGEGLELTFSRCTAPFLPCRDTLDALAKFSGQTSGGESAGAMLSVPGGGSKSGKVSMRDSPGNAVPLAYPDAATGPYKPTHSYWQMEFTIVLGAYQMGVFLPLRNASWTLASAVDIDVDKKTTTGMKGAVVHRDWKTGAPDNIDIPSAMAGPTCRLLARSIERPPQETACQPAVRKV